MIHDIPRLFAEAEARDAASVEAYGRRITQRNGTWTDGSAKRSCGAAAIIMAGAGLSIVTAAVVIAAKLGWI